MTKFHVREPSYDWDEIVEGVKMAAEECGEPLTGQEYDNWQATSEEDFPTIRWIQRRAAGWKEVCKRAGVQSGGGSKYTDDEVLSAIERAAADVGEPLTQTEYISWRESIDGKSPSVTTITNRFDWEEACEKAGVSGVTHRAGRGSKYTDDEVLSAIERAAADVGEPLTRTEYHEWRQEIDENQPSITTITDRFDWKKACEKAGVSGVVEKRYTDDDLLSAIERAAADVGEPLIQMGYISWRKNTDENQPSISAITYRFGWEEACEKAGVSGVVGKRYTDDEVLSAIERAAADVGEPLTQTEYREWRQEIDDDAPSVSVVSRLGWEDICARANVDYKYNKTYSDSDIVEAIERAAADVGEPLTQTMYQSWRDNTEGKYPSVNTVKTRLGWKSDHFQAELK